jgi:predicted  nucleic acid-binding Zn-ribbon protein
MSTVGLQGAAALLANAGNLERYKALLQHKADAKAVQDDVADLETRATDVKTKITEVEKEVSIGGADLLQKLKKVTSPGVGDSLSSRVTALEEVVASLKDRTKMMEEAISKADLSGRVATLDAELTSLTNRVGILMSTVGLEAAAAFLAKAGTYERYTAILKGKHDATTIKDDVDALETEAQDVKTKITQVENSVAGTQIGGSLLEKSQIKLSSREGDEWSLTSRVSSLEEVVLSLQDRAKAMELQVAGSASKAL